ncbi:unnamed protein product [Caenorhabditis auriculariae]|uniref:Uncharacterized protein n=1 Tax=Caenorhabditis auriculariae TaxID=2777116 RepID=A0A8S1GV99_9PELO|nr:unnamed protein product [Caenorhabditis auriculariae]
MNIRRIDKRSTVVFDVGATVFVVNSSSIGTNIGDTLQSDYRLCITRRVEAEVQKGRLNREAAELADVPPAVLPLHPNRDGTQPFFSVLPSFFGRFGAFCLLNIHYILSSSRRNWMDYAQKDKTKDRKNMFSTLSTTLGREFQRACVTVVRAVAEHVRRRLSNLSEALPCVPLYFSPLVPQDHTSFTCLSDPIHPPRELLAHFYRLAFWLGLAANPRAAFPILHLWAMTLQMAVIGASPMARQSEFGVACLKFR